jgi:hypothetical protein
MKFSLIKNVIGALAPTLGSALGGPLGGQAASVIAGVFLVVNQTPNLLTKPYKRLPQNKCLSLKKQNKILSYR